MSLAVFVQNQHNFPVNAARLRQAALTVLKRLRPDSRPQVTIVLVDDASIRRLNLAYRQMPSETDVLSFPAAPAPVEDGSDSSFGSYLGDILIAYPYAKRVAQRKNLDLEDTMQMLIAHGLLHLLGHDHDDEAAKKAMWQAQAAALQAIGIDPAIVEQYGGG